ncbi:class I SAM-dependent methyltransferase [Micromonospora sp. HM5-17]|uniref:class I SAM-dependent methyltransferase n=1 Tax=Micromonospora sp. HM5-17 TaxID=2487710 RepID=UPI000F45FD41|nr:class I SAM-dependent methyltransferase [Micromonospora sp. HM5-17]ROT31663.1 class I SAM-dependent methyltransferase [Micromonospora sp. HM5-17]
MPVTDEVIAERPGYHRLLLASYDRYVLGLSRLIWRCPHRHVLAGYERNIGLRHLELGPGTAYFLDRCEFPTPRPELTLVDLNPTVLRVSASRIARYRPTTLRADVLQPLPFDAVTLPAGTFDSVAANFLLHRVPGNWVEKGAVLDNALTALRPDGRIFGSTILSAGVRVTPLARRFMRLYNRRGTFHNGEDDLAGLRWQLDTRFANIRLTVRGCVALFEASKPDSDAALTREGRPAPQG